MKLPKLEEYREWFKDFADLYREDGILQVTWKTLNGPMQHSGMSHRAMSQLTRVLSLDWENEIIIFTHIGNAWMTESDPNDWRYTYPWMQQPPTRESWEGFRTKPFEWFKKVEAGEEVNRYDPSIPVEPYRPKPADE